MTSMPVQLSVAGRKRRTESPTIKSGEVTVVRAALGHVDAITQLVDYWALQGENLPRPRHEILAALTEFAVAVYEGNVVGCGSLFVYGPKLAEIRSLGVDPCHHGLGVGSALVRHFIEAARLNHIPRVFVLTRAPLFFERNGFSVVSIEVLPEKVFKDCAKCTKRAACDEIAMIRDLT